MEAVTTKFGNQSKKVPHETRAEIYLSKKEFNYLKKLIDTDEFKSVFEQAKVKKDQIKIYLNSVLLNDLYDIVGNLLDSCSESQLEMWDALYDQIGWMLDELCLTQENLEKMNT